MTISQIYEPEVLITSTSLGPYIFFFFVQDEETVVAGVGEGFLPPTEYSVILNPDQENNPGGQFFFTNVPVAGLTLTIGRVTPITQLVDYEPFTSFPAETHEFALDKLALICQELFQGQLLIDGQSIVIDTTEFTRLTGNNSQSVFASTDGHIDALYVAGVVLQNNIDGNTALISTNSGLIAVNTGAIAGNTADILTNATAIGALADNTVNTEDGNTFLFSDGPSGPFVQDLPLGTEEIFMSPRTQNNSSSANALLQLDANGLVPIGNLPAGNIELQGIWNPTIDGATPPVTMANGWFYIFNGAGNMTLFESDDQTAHTVAVSSGDAMLALVGATGFADGWYYIQLGTGGAVLASDVVFDNTGTSYDSVQVQAILEEIDGLVGSNAFGRLAGGNSWEDEQTFDSDTAIVSNTDARLKIFGSQGGIDLANNASGNGFIQQLDSSGVPEASFIVFWRNSGVEILWGPVGGKVIRILTTAAGVDVTGVLNVSGRVISAAGVTVGGTLTGATTGSFSGAVTANGVTSTNGVAVGGALTGATTGTFGGAITAAAGVTNANLTRRDTYATPTLGGTLKARLTGSDLFLTNNGANP